MSSCIGHKSLRFAVTTKVIGSRTRFGVHMSKTHLHDDTLHISQMHMYGDISMLINYIPYFIAYECMFSLYAIVCNTKSGYEIECYRN